MKDLITQLLKREISAPLTASAGARKRTADKFSLELEALAKEVKKSWNGKQDAAGAVREQRRG